MGSSLRTTFAHIFLCLHEAVLWNLSIKFTGDMLIILFYFSKMRNKLSFLGVQVGLSPSKKKFLFPSIKALLK